MGYDVHITRAKRWTDSAAHPIADAEWRACLASNPELERLGADFREGRIVFKNPDEADIPKLIAVANSLRARVEGDDGEVYEKAGQPPRPATLSLRERMTAWFDRLRPAPTFDPIELPFKKGDKVIDAWGKEGVVTGIELAANVGLGEVRVRLKDGRELTYPAIAHGLTPVERP